MIKIRNLKKQFDGLEVLKDINITIQDGEIYGLVGRSGAGKSTLLRCINGLVSYDAGSLKVDDVEINCLNKQQSREFRRNIGMIFQHFALLERRNVYDNIALPMKCWGYSKKQIDKRVMELLDLVNITDKVKARPRELSGGQKQRVAIARALAMEPKILLCDEATSALDPNTTQSILKLLREINQKLGITMVVVTHQMSVVKDLCDKISILEHGGLAVTGLVEDVFMDQPPALDSLLGNNDVILPSHGTNIRFLLNAKQSQEPIITILGKECNTDIAVVGGNMEKYRDKMLGYLIINIPEERSADIEKCLTKLNYRWERMVTEK